MFAQKTSFLFTIANLAIFACNTYASVLQVRANDVDGFEGSSHQPCPFTSQILNRTNAEDQSGLIGFTVDGMLEEYGHIAGDGTFNYHSQKNNQSYGGGFNIGTNDAKNSSKVLNGIGGGYSFNKTNIDIGAGINGFDNQVNFHLDIQKDNKIVIEFDVTGKMVSSLNCVPNNNGKTKGMKCTTSVLD